MVQEPGLFTVANVTEMQRRLMDAISQTAVYAVGISSLFTIGVLMILKPKRETIAQAYGFRRLTLLNVLSVLGLGFLVYWAINLLVGLTPWPQNWMDALEQSTGMVLGGGLWVSILFTTITVPIAEELLFRGAIYGALKKGMAKPIALILQAVIFGVMHGNMIQGIYAFALGVVLALIYERTKSIWAPILMHMLVNGISSILSEIGEQNIQDFLGSSPFAALAVLSACMVFGILGMLGIILLNRKQKKNQIRSDSDIAL